MSMLHWLAQRRSPAPGAPPAPPVAVWEDERTKRILDLTDAWHFAEAEVRLTWAEYDDAPDELKGPYFVRYVASLDREAAAADLLAEAVLAS